MGIDADDGRMFRIKQGAEDPGGPAMSKGVNAAGLNKRNHSHLTL
jgi:hypothetical protein